MSRALYDPERGYYSRRITAVGRRGDFTTAPMLSEAPARAIAAWAVRAMRESGCQNLIEIGPGEGTLSHAVMKQLPWHVRWKTRLHLVETSVPLTARQRRLLGSRARWHHTPQDALAACRGNAVIFSNEWVDAFPVRRFEKTDLGWQELAIHLDEMNRPTESLLPPGTLPQSSTFSEPHNVGQRIEVHESFHRNLTEWLPLWKFGQMLTIDYGAKAPELYHRRPQGSIRGYLHQQRLEGMEVYQNPGRQDLTADVNFTDLQDWSAPWTSEQRLMTFRQFLTEHTVISAADYLLDDRDAADAFLVLHQKR